MPKRKAISRLSSLVESDDEDVIQASGKESASAQTQNTGEPPAKRARGRPKTANPKAADTQSIVTKRHQVTTARTEHTAPPDKQRGRGRPKSAAIEPRQVSQGSGKNGRNPSDNKTQERSSQDELGSPKNATRETNPGGPAVTPVGKTLGFKHTNADGGFQYTPLASLRSTAKERLKDPSTMPTTRLDITEADKINMVEQIENTQESKETPIRDEIPSSTQKRTFSPSKALVNGQIAQRPRHEMPRKRTPGITSDNENAISEPDLRRKLGDMTRRYETLEGRFRTLREIGIVEASANVEKVRKQCEATAAGMFFLSSDTQY